MRMDWSKLNVLITGGTGSFGRKFIEIMLRDWQRLIASYEVEIRVESAPGEQRLATFQDGGGHARPTVNELGIMADGCTVVAVD